VLPGNSVNRETNPDARQSKPPVKEEERVFRNSSSATQERKQ
jgi:hypothetical protein